MQRAIVTAWLASDDPDQALETAQSITDRRQQVEAFTKIGGRFFGMERREEAKKTLLQARALSCERYEHWTDHELNVIVGHLVEAGEYDPVIDIVQQEWRRGVSRRELLNGLPLVGGLVSRVPDLGKEIYSSAEWVEKFLGAA